MQDQDNPNYGMNLSSTNEQLHQGSQFLAIIGKNLIKEKPDDSQSNIGIIAGGLIGRKVNGPNPFHAFLDIPGFSLNLIDPGMTRIWSTNLNGKNRDEILKELKLAVNQMGLDDEKLKFIDHYKIEKDHPIQHGAVFEKPEESQLRDWHSLYSDARINLRDASGPFELADEVRIWPHHFDIGSYIPLNQDGTSAMGIGVAVPDSVVDDFYYYIYAWQKDKVIDMTGFIMLSEGIWKTGDWNGAVMPVSQLKGNNSSERRKIVNTFYKESMEEYLKALK